MLDEARARIGRLYPKVKAPDGTERTVIAWIWARTVRSPNPANPIEVPLVRSWWLGKKKGKEAQDLAGQSVSGDFNSAFGNAAGYRTTGSENTALGRQAGQVVLGNFNLASGYVAGDNVTGNGNTASGVQAGQNITGNFNVATGVQAGQNVTGSQNTATGPAAGQRVTGTDNVGTGTRSGDDVTGSANTATVAPLTASRERRALLSTDTRRLGVCMVRVPFCDGSVVPS